MKKVMVIGGGASGMACAVMLARKGVRVCVLERGERLGRKLSATGNGQGNVTNRFMGAEHYFSDDREKVARALARFSEEDTVRFLESMGGIFLLDARGRIYPCGRQASAVTDLFRRELSRLGVCVRTGTQVRELVCERGVFCARGEWGEEDASAAVLSAGGCAAPAFGTDGSAYSLAQGFGHTVVPCFPALVQLQTEPSLRGLKGVRVDANVRLLRGKEEIYATRGDVLFTENGVSGDAVFRVSSYANTGDLLLLDFLPDVSERRLSEAFDVGGDLLCIVGNGLARIIVKRAGGDWAKTLGLVKRFPLEVSGTSGFSNAQVTRGGIPLCETDEALMSRLQNGLYFTGEILNVDGECGGYNLQWAFTSAWLVAEGFVCN